MNGRVSAHTLKSVMKHDPPQMQLLTTTYTNATRESFHHKKKPSEHFCSNYLTKFFEHGVWKGGVLINQSKLYSNISTVLKC